MLRRKLLFMLGPLVALLVVVSVVAIVLLQRVLRQMDRISAEAWVMVEKVSELGTTISLVEVDLARIQSGQQRRLDELIDRVELMGTLVHELGQHDLVQQPGCRECYQRLVEGLPRFERHISALATAQDPDLADRHNRSALASAVQLRQAILSISRYARQHAQSQQEALATDFRGLVFGLAVVFLVVINVSVLILLRMAGMILRPVDELVQASRQLGQEKFDYRVKLDQDDEFGDLARAYNHLAEQLQSNEQRKLEMLGQVALALNHELNNAMATISLQLQLLERHSAGDAALEGRLRQINENLERMAHTVEQLKHVRRVVLTDYVRGVKMLDLQRSVQAEDSPEAAEPAPGGGG